MEIELDYYEDARAFLAAELAKVGYQTKASDDFDKVFLRYFQVIRRLVETTPRKFLPAPELSVPPHLQTVFGSFVGKIQAGADLVPHLSRGVRNTAKEDLLLNDWGIHHFHLGQTLESDGFVARTDPVLFARVTDEAVYALLFLPHGAWAYQELVKVIHRNWPATISFARARGVLGLADKLSDDDILKLRTAGVQTMIEMDDGTVYMPIGGGISTAKTSMKDRLYADRLRKMLRGAVDWIRANPGKLEDALQRAGHAVPAKLKLNLEIGRDPWRAIDPVSGAFVEVPPQFCW